MAEPTALWIAQEFCRRTSLPVPGTLTGSTDDTTLQIWGLMNEGAQDIADRYNLQELQQLKTFQHADGSNYLAYDLAGLADYKFLLYDTLWATVQQLRVEGPKSLREWAQLTASLTAGAKYLYSLFGNAIHIFDVPSPTSSETFSFYYQSRYLVLDATAPNGVSAETYLTDSSTPRIPWNLVMADLRWRYKKEKGLPYAEDQRMSEGMLVNHAGRQEQGELVLDACGRQDASPVVMVPAWSWPL